MGKSRLSRNIWSAISKVADLWTIIAFLLGWGSGGGTVVAVLNHIPSYYPIILGILSFALIVFSIIRTIIRYNRWEAVKNDPTLLKILKTLQDLHNQLGELSIPVSKRRIGKSTLLKISARLSKLMNIDREQYEKLRQQSFSDETWKFLVKRMSVTYKIKRNDFISLTGMLVAIGKTMDRESCGLSQVREEATYKKTYQELKNFQLELNLSDPDNALWIKNAYDYSFGLHSMAVGFGFMEKQKKFIENTPTSYIDFADTTIDCFDAIYTNVLLRVKQAIMDDLWKGAK
jgi:hypothetical protein